MTVQTKQRRPGKPPITSFILTGNDTLDRKRLKTLLILEGINQEFVVKATGVHKANVSLFIARKRNLKKLVDFFEHLAHKHPQVFDIV